MVSCLLVYLVQLLCVCLLFDLLWVNYLDFSCFVQLVGVLVSCLLF